MKAYRSGICLRSYVSATSGNGSSSWKISMKQTVAEASINEEFSSPQYLKITHVINLEL